MELASLVSEAISWTTEDEWVVELSRPLRHLPRVTTPEEEAFWPTYSWAENPWVVDMQVNVLTSTISQFQLCPIAKLHLQQVGCRTYFFVLPKDDTVAYQLALRRWGLATLISAPSLEVGQELHVRTDLRLATPHN